MNIDKVDFDPNDIIIISTENAISEETANRLKDRLAKTLEIKNKISVLSEGLKLSILSPQE